MKPSLSAQSFALTLAALALASEGAASEAAPVVTATETSPSTRLGDKDEKKDDKDEKKDETPPKKGGDEGGCGAGSCG